MHAQGGLPIPGHRAHWPALLVRRTAGPTGPEPRRLRPACAPLAGWRRRSWNWVPDKVAAFIGEPVQGAGGVIIPPATYWPEIQRICDKYGILLVSDEVICAFRPHRPLVRLRDHGHKPDLMTFAKGVTSGYIPLGGVMVGDRVAKVLIEQGGEFNHGYTYSAATPWPARWRWPTSS
jgi:putrescine aminotransferase